MELRRFFDLLWRRKWIIIVTAIVTIAAVVAGTHYTKQVYTASAVLRVAASASGTLNYQDYMYTDRLMNTYVQLAKSEPMAQELMKRLSLSQRPAIDAQVIPSTELIRITVEDANPAQASKVANSLAEILVTQDSQLYTGTGIKLTDVLQAQLTEVQKDLDQTRQSYGMMLLLTPAAPDNIEATKQLLTLKQANYASLLSQYQQAQFREEIRASMVSVWQPAVPPQKPTHPVPLLNYGLGLLAGLVGGLALALVFENLDTRLYSTAEIEAAAGRDAAVCIPKGNAKQMAPVAGNYSPVAEAFRNLAMLLHRHHGGDKGKALLVISPEPSQGKSTVILHLAVSLAELGKQVVVIDCDTRVPRLHALFRLSNNPGLKDLLEKTAKQEDVIQSSSYDGVSVITSGSPLPHPSQMLGSSEMTDLVMQLRKRYDYILLDSPALLAAADAAALRPYADFLILVAQRGYARREAVQAAGSFLKESGDKDVYLIVNQAEKNRGYDYYKGRVHSQSLAD